MSAEIQSLPRVSVVMPVRNEEQYIAMAVRSIGRQNYPQELIDVIVVDNGSTDGSVQAATAAGAKVVVKTNCRVGAVRNEGARISAGQVLAFLDSDCEAGPDWLRKAVELLNSNEGIGAVGGMYRTPVHATWVERVWAPNRELRSEDVDFLACSGLIVARGTFERLNGFDERLEAAEDDDFSRRVRGLRLRVMSVPECAVVHHGYPQKLTAIARRQMWHGTNQLESARGLTDRLLILTHLFLLGLLVLPLSLLRGPWVLAAGIALALGVVFVATAGRIHAHRYREADSKLFVQLYVVLLFYFSGRALGLLKNYVQLLTRRKRRSP